MKTKFYKIEDITVMEIEVPEISFEYYVRDNTHAFEFSFGVEPKNRFSKNGLQNLYRNGYFNHELERV